MAAIRRTKGDIVQGTCAWLLHETKYLDWESEKGHRLLQIQGGPGVGKTMISAFLVDVLDRKASHDSEMTLAYYFCDNGDERRNTATAILRGLLLQLLRQRPILFQHIQEDYVEMEDRLPELLESLDGLWRIFRSILSDSNIGKLYILVDALDECEKSSRQDFLISLRSLFVAEQLDEQRTIKFLITCRPEEKMDENLRCVGNCLRLDPAKIKFDVSRFIDDKVDRLPDHYPHALKQEIKTTLSNKSGGSFLWASLVLCDISKTTVPSKVRGKLRSLPSTLSEVYGRMLKNIDEEDREEAMLILQLVAIARTPLTTTELAMALVLSAEWEKSELPASDDLEEREYDYKCCEPLLCHDKETGTVSLVHQSAKDYLLTSSFNSSEANLLMLRICWRYFGMEEFHQGTTIIRRSAKNELVRESLSNEFLEGHVFLRYAAKEWQEHALAAHSSLTAHTWDSNNLGRLPTFRDSWLLRAAANGQEEVTRLLLENDADVTATDERGRTALHRASLNGCEAVVRLLVDKRADLTAIDANGWTTLHWASESGHEALVRLLLEKRVDVNVQNDEGITALHLAVAGRYEAIVRLLLENGADVNAKGDDGMTALHITFIKRSEAIAILLIENGADINAKYDCDDGDDGFATAFPMAIAIGSEAIVQLLLENGVDVNAAIDDESTTALHLAVLMGNEAIVRVLLNNGANINAKEEDEGKTALDVAYLIKNEAIVQLLQEKGGLRGDNNDNDNEDIDNYGAIALFTTIMSGSKEGVESLIRNGADVNAKYDDDDSDDEANLTPLAMAVSTGNQAIVRLLLEEGADVDAEIDEDGVTALHLAVFMGEEAIVRLLLEKGADINAQEDDEGMTPLHLAVECGMDTIVRLLLAKGADVSVRDHEGKTVQDQAHFKGREAVVRLLSPVG